MGSKAGSIEALLVRHVVLNGEDAGEWIMLDIGSQQELAEVLGVNYANMTRRIRESKYLVLDGSVLRLKKDGEV
jgi:hypothetical protein